MLLSELQTRLRIYLDDRSGDRYSAAELTGLLNAGQAEVQKIIDDADEAYFEGAKTYDVQPCPTAREFNLPADFKKIILAERIFDDAKPVPVNWTSLQRRYVETDIEWIGAPLCYLRGNMIGVVTPTDTYVLRLWYTRRIVDLAGDTDVSEIPLEYHDLMCIWAARKGLSAEGRKWSDTLERELTEGIDRLRVHIETRQRQTPARVICKDREW